MLTSRRWMMLVAFVAIFLAGYRMGFHRGQTARWDETSFDDLIELIATTAADHSTDEWSGTLSLDISGGQVVHEEKDGFEDLEIETHAVDDRETLDRGL